MCVCVCVCVFVCFVYFVCLCVCLFVCVCVWLAGPRRRHRRLSQLALHRSGRVLVLEQLQDPAAGLRALPGAASLLFFSVWAPFVEAHCHTTERAQLMFACITPLLLTGAYAERMRFKASFMFTILWEITIYYPLAHWSFFAVASPLLSPSCAFLLSRGDNHHLQDMGRWLAPADGRRGLCRGDRHPHVRRHSSHRVRPG